MDRLLPTAVPNQKMKPKNETPVREYEVTTGPGTRSLETSRHVIRAGLMGPKELTQFKKESIPKYPRAGLLHQDVVVTQEVHVTVRTLSVWKTNKPKVSLKNAYLSAMLGLVALLVLNGCTVISNDRVFPKLAPFWTAEAKAQRESNAHQKAYREVGEQLIKDAPR